MVGAASLQGMRAADGVAGPWMERIDAGRCWAGAGGGLGEAATARGKWRGGRGGDGEREVERRGRRRRHEGGGEEGEATATGDLGDAARAWRFGGAGAGPGQPRTGSRIPLQLVFWEKTRIIQVQGGLQDPIANSLKPIVAKDRIIKEIELSLLQSSTLFRGAILFF